MLNFFTWYLTISTLGLLTFPLAYRLFPTLADRGYALSRTLGLLLWAFAFWLAVSLGLAQNDAGGLLLGLVVLAVLNVLANLQTETKKDGTSTRTLDFLSPVEWLKENWRYVLTVEVLFIAAFAFMAFIRANNPDATGTEKPMELAFINAILNSPTFPPHDPWLSGYAISYYYFGYVMTAMLAHFTSTPGTVAFNLMLSLVFGLGAVGSFGVVYNLLRAYWQDVESAGRALFGALLAPLFLLIISNVEGFLEVLHSLGLGWGGAPGDQNLWARLGQLGQASPQAYNFWTWMNIKDLNMPPTGAVGWSPRFWFWWRASRVVADVDFMGNFPEVIDEFPFFSFLLGDLHPHVLAFPFALLVVGMALNLFLGGWRGETSFRWFSLPVRREGLAVLAVALGGLAFLNTWDFPIYLAVVVGALVMQRVREDGWDWVRLEEILVFSIPLVVASIVLYLPFYIGFSSQAGGILPNAIYPTRGAHLWVMFGTLFVPLFALIFHLVKRRRFNWKVGFGVTLGFVLLLWVLSLLMGVIAARTEIGASFIQGQGMSGLGALLGAASLRRLAYIGGLLTLVLLLGAGTAYITAKQDEVPGKSRIDSLPFVMGLVIIAGLLALGPDFVYLRDQFGGRMNTVFKFYYQAWLMWSLVASFGAAVLFAELRGLAGRITQVGLALVIAIGLFYPVLAIPEKTGGFDPFGGRRLDAFGNLELFAGDDARAIRWLETQPQGVVAEAVGGSYSEYARVATYSGRPTVLGWPGHESQWRGGYEPQGSRNDDIRALYETPDWQMARQIVERYGIDYVYVGTLERNTYRVNEEKFALFLTELYRDGQVVIYGAP